MLAAGVVLRWVQLLVLGLRSNAKVKHKRVSWLRIRIDEGLSKEAVPTVHPYKNRGRIRKCDLTIIPLGAALSAASLPACLLGASGAPCVCLVPAGH